MRPTTLSQLASAAVSDDAVAHGNAPPARDPLQLHLVLRPRDRDPAAGCARLGGPQPPCARSVRPAAPHACCTRCWATSGWSSATPTCRTTCSTTRKRRCLLIEALRHRLGEVEKAPHARRPIATRDAASSENCSLQAGAAVANGSRRSSTRWPSCGGRRNPGCWAASPQKDNIKFDGLSAGVPRHRCHRLARRVPLRRADARQRGRDGGSGQGLHRTRPDHHPARAAAPATPAARSR